MKTMKTVVAILSVCLAASAAAADPAGGRKAGAKAPSQAAPARYDWEGNAIQRDFADVREQLGRHYDHGVLIPFINPDFQNAHLRAAPGGQLRGWVRGIVNGHTVQIVETDDRNLNRQIEVVLAGVESPQTNCTQLVWKEYPVWDLRKCQDTYGEPFGREAKESLARLALGRYVVVALSGEMRDARPVGTVYMRGLDLGLAQIILGYGFAVPPELDPSLPPALVDVYAMAQDEARGRRAKVWKADYVVVPWEKRRRMGDDPKPGVRSSQPNEMVRIEVKGPTEAEPLPGEVSVTAKTATVRDVLNNVFGLGLTPPAKIGIDAKDVRDGLAGKRQEPQAPKVYSIPFPGQKPAEGSK
jgi:endonuclease YncB( thermonuclease family)